MANPSEKIVLADYFLGFSTRSVSGQARPWRLYYESEEDAGIKEPKCKAAFSGDLYLTGDIKDVASTYYPEIGPYDTTDPDVAEYHVLLAKAAGIDGFMAEYTMGQEENLLCLVRAAVKYDFRIGVNWINQSHLGENKWRDRGEAIEKAKQQVRWLAENVYKPCGVRVDEKYLMLIFLAHPRQAKGLDNFFSPDEVRILKQTAADAGCDANFLVLPWENLPEAGEKAERVWDGYFPWVWASNGKPVPENTGWTLATTREDYIQRLREYYASARRLQVEGRIGMWIGAVCPGFDDHKGQAWGEAQKRHVPRDDGGTLDESWRELKNSGASAALIITWNDWVESSQIEPSLELGYADLRVCAKEITFWKHRRHREPMTFTEPKMLFDARKAVQLRTLAGINSTRLQPITQKLDETATAICARELNRVISLWSAATAELRSIELIKHDIHLFWEYGFDCIGIEAVATGRPTEITADNSAGIALQGERTAEGFFLTDVETIQRLRRGYFVGKICFEYLDVGADFVRVLVDNENEHMRIIASFKKTNSGKWRRATLDVVNCRFLRSLQDGADFQIAQRPGTAGGVRMVRIDGTVHVAPKALTACP